MSIVYLLQNQHQHYLDKSGEWVAPENTKSLYRAQFKDEAINRKVEFSVKNVELRIVIKEASVAANGKVELAGSAANTEPNNPSIEEPIVSEKVSANGDLFAHEAMITTEDSPEPMTLEPMTVSQDDDV